MQQIQECNHAKEQQTNGHVKNIYQYKYRICGKKQDRGKRDTGAAHAVNQVGKKYEGDQAEDTHR
jgi:hypothetical protein